MSIVAVPRNASIDAMYSSGPKKGYNRQYLAAFFAPAAIVQFFCSANKSPFFFLSHSQFSYHSSLPQCILCCKIILLLHLLLCYFSIISIYFIIFFFSSISTKSYGTDFEFIFYYNCLIQLNSNYIYFMVSYSDFIIFNFYECYGLMVFHKKKKNSR